MTARVQGGRLVLNEPTNLPEGATVGVQAIDGDELSDEDRERLHRELDEAEAEFERGEGLPKEEVWARLGW